MATKEIKSRSLCELKDLDEQGDLGVVHAVVSCFGNVDHDDEIVDAGAFLKSIERGKADPRKMPKGVWYHDPRQPVARTKEAWETSEGVHVIGAFNLETQRGRETFSDIKAGLIDQYSFGFRTTEEAKDSDGRRHIKNTDWLEWSPVLLAANDQTYTVDAKSRSLPAGDLPFDEDARGVLAAAEALLERAKSIHDYRQTEGRTISEERVVELKSLLDRFEGLMALVNAPPPAPKPSPKEILEVQAHYERLRLARLRR